MKTWARCLAAISVAFFLSAGLAMSEAAADEAQTRELTATLKKSRDLIERGRDGEARKLLDPVLADPSTPADLMALAFFFRGVANDRLKQPQAALADFDSALWFDSLPAQLQAQAHVRRASSLMQLGRVADAKKDAELAQSLAPGDATIVQAVEAIRRAPDAATPAPGQTSVIAKSEERVLQAAIADSAPPPTPAATETTAALAQPVAPATSRFAIQLGAISNTASAQSEWQRISAGNSDLLGGLEPRYVERGNLIKLQAGPLASYQASVDLCQKLKQRGQDCFAVPPR